MARAVICNLSAVPLLVVTKTTTVYFGSDGFISEKAEPGNADTDALWATQRNLTPLTIPRVYSTGQLPAYGADNAYSPYVMLNYTGMSNTRHFRGKSTVELKQDLSMVTKGLSARAQIAYDTELNLKEKRYVPRDVLRRSPSLYRRIGTI